MKQPNTIVITGASSGFGQLAAKTIASAGHRVYATMRQTHGKNEHSATQLRAWAKQQACDLRVVDMDVASDDSVRAAIASIEAEVGAIDVLINNAGVMNVGIGEAWSGEEVARQLDVNVVGPHRTARAVLPKMRARRDGLIINVSSIAGRYTTPYFGLYSASKAALEMMTEGMRYETSSFGVECVIVQPGPFATDLGANSPTPADSQVTQSYGRFNQVLEGINQGFVELFAAQPAAVDAQHVADALLNLVQAEKGSRPFRTVVGVDFGIAEFNARTEYQRANVLEAMKVPYLDNIAQAQERLG